VLFIGVGFIPATPTYRAHLNSASQHYPPHTSQRLRGCLNMEYMQVPRPEGDGYCSDDGCPCGYPGTRIPRGTGYVYVSEEAVEFRRDAPTVEEAQRKIARLQQQLGAHAMFGSGTVAPILMCEQGARKRKLDLEIAAADARYWWETGLVPLRPTPKSRVQSRQFQGNTVEAAKAAAARAIPAEQIRDLQVTQQVEEKYAEGEGASAEEAIRAAQGRVPAVAFEVSAAEITQEGQQGTIQVQADSETQAHQAWVGCVPVGASAENVRCLTPPVKGFLGMGKRAGLWEVEWSVPFIARISYKSPAVVTVWYKP
jgi:hypothetical protein